jgi:hypothetical protein
VSWLTPVILATEKAQIKRITIQSQTNCPGKYFGQTLSRKYPIHNTKQGWLVGRMTQMVESLPNKPEALEFKKGKQQSYFFSQGPFLLMSDVHYITNNIIQCGIKYIGNIISSFKKKYLRTTSTVS